MYFLDLRCLDWSTFAIVQGLRKGGQIIYFTIMGCSVIILFRGGIYSRIVVVRIFILCHFNLVLFDISSPDFFESFAEYMTCCEVWQHYYLQYCIALDSGSVPFSVSFVNALDSSISSRWGMPMYIRRLFTSVRVRSPQGHSWSCYDAIDEWGCTAVVLLHSKDLKW